MLNAGYYYSWQAILSNTRLLITSILVVNTHLNNYSVIAKFFIKHYHYVIKV